MLRYLRFPTLAAARGHANALAVSKAYTRGGRPPLPRCDSGRWGDPEISQGANCVPCSCASRDAPEDDCPYATRAAVDVVQLAGGSYAVEAFDAHTRAGIDTAAATPLAEDDDPRPVRS